MVDFATDSWNHESEKGHQGESDIGMKPRTESDSISNDYLLNEVLRIMSFDVDLRRFPIIFNAIYEY